jgi:hypothetical protein
MMLLPIGILTTEFFKGVIYNIAFAVWLCQHMLKLVINIRCIHTCIPGLPSYQAAKPYSGTFWYKSVRTYIEINQVDAVRAGSGHVAYGAQYHS